jgi:hypothetical protein
MKCILALALVCVSSVDAFGSAADAIYLKPQYKNWFSSAADWAKNGAVQGTNYVLPENAFSKPFPPSMDGILLPAVIVAGLAYEIGDSDFNAAMAKRPCLKERFKEFEVSKGNSNAEISASTMDQNTGDVYTTFMGTDNFAGVVTDLQLRTVE